MKTILLAAGTGERLGQDFNNLPKCLLEFGGKTLLARHLEILSDCGIESVTICTGYQADKIHAAVDAYRVKPDVSFIHNPGYQLGSVLSLWCTNAVLASGEAILLMDADVLYGREMLARLIGSIYENCFLLDRDFAPGDEPVKLCVRDNQLREFRKRIEGQYDLCGESVGFFRFSPKMAKILADKVRYYIDQDRQDEPHEEALRDVLLSAPAEFGYEDVTGIPWTEIDFPEDVEHARNVILPRLI